MGGNVREPVEPKTLTALYGAAKTKGWTRKDVSDVAEATFGKHPEDLTQREAEVILEHIATGTGLPEPFNN